MAQSTFEFLVTLDVESATSTANSEIEALLAGQTEVLYNGEWLRLGDAMAAWLLALLPQSVSEATVLITAPQDDDNIAEEVPPALGGSGVGPGTSLGFKKTRSPRRSTRFTPRSATRKTASVPRRTTR
jgi:hypothetical protein